MNKFKINIIFLMFCMLLLSAKNSNSLKFQPVISRAGEISDLRNNQLKVLAVMVDFQLDTLRGTTGNGKFNSGFVYPDSLKIDAGNHDSSYFYNKLKFVRNYFNSVSNEKVDFPLIKILPQIVHLDKPIWYFNYNNGNSDFLSSRLVELHKSVWASARLQIDSTELKTYDTFVIFHAGSGQEFSLEYDETPFDIPSVFLDQEELNKYGAADPFINSSIILPECEWQVSDVYKTPKWHFASMNGAMVLMFAHRLGLPNLYSSSDNKSGVGRFDLMDQGSGNFSGLIPAGPSAWCREYLGWSDIKNLDNFQDNTRIPVCLNSDTYRLELDRNEYLLMEFRRAQNVGKDTAYGYDYSDNIVARFFKKDYNDKIEVLPGMENSVITSIGDRLKRPYYDYAIPASGIFIWHVDKRKTTPDIVKNNKVNEDYDNRGVYLEEADGSFDIGKSYWLLDGGYGTELGWTYDAFFDSNMVWRDYSNKNLYQEINTVAYNTRSYPTADNNSGIPVNISIYGFSNPPQKTDTMTFKFKRTGLDSAFALENCGKNFKLLYHSLDENKFAVTGNNSQVAIKNINNGKDTSFVSINTDNFKIHAYKKHVYWFKDFNNSLIYNQFDLTADSLYTNNLPGKALLMPIANSVLTDSGLFNLSKKQLNRQIKNINTFAVDSINADSSLIVFLKNDSLFQGFLGGNWQFSQTAVRKVAGLSLLAKIRIVVNENKLPVRFIIQDGASLYSVDSELKKIEILSGLNNPLAVFDADMDGKPEFISRENDKTVIKNQFGNLENGFPLNYNIDDVTSNGVLAYSLNGNHTILTIDTIGILQGFTQQGEKISNLRQVLPVGSSKNTLTDLIELNGKMYLSVARTDSGRIQYYNLGEGTLDLDANLPGGNWSNSYNNVIKMYKELNVTDAKLFKNGSVYNWPNPAKGAETNFRFFLTSAAAVSVKIYDLSGMKITELSQKYSNFGDYCELKWNLQGVASGIYLAAVKVTNGSKTENYQVKVAVAK